MVTNWFGVKTLFRTRAVGRAKAIDHAFDPYLDMVEERIVLVRARSFDAATTVLAKASESSVQLIDRWFGPLERVSDKRRLKLLNQEYSGVVGHGSVWRPEKLGETKGKSKPRA